MAVKRYGVWRSRGSVAKEKAYSHIYSKNQEAPEEHIRSTLRILKGQ